MRDSLVSLHAYLITTIIPGVKDDDIFWVDAVHQMYVERHSKGRDDLLFFVKWDAKQVCLH